MIAAWRRGTPFIASQHAGHTITHDSKAVDRVMVVSPLSRPLVNAGAPLRLPAQANQRRGGGGEQRHIQRFVQRLRGDRPELPGDEQRRDRQRDLPDSLAAERHRDLDDLPHRQRRQQPLQQHRAEHAFAEHARARRRGSRDRRPGSRTARPGRAAARRSSGCRSTECRGRSPRRSWCRRRRPATCCAATTGARRSAPRPPPRRANSQSTWVRRSVAVAGCPQRGCHARRAW